MIKSNSVINNVKEYYGKTLISSNDLKTSACCPTDDISDSLKPLLANIHPEILSKFYGCGSPIPPNLKDKVVLDLGCGTGRDVYIVSQLVQENGHVIGVDMTDEQLNVANRYIQHHMDRFGYNVPNVSFHKGYIEDLRAIGLEDNSVDVVISNCVINLSSDKESVFKEIFRVLKPGGELYFSDVFADRRIPEEIANDPVFLGECLGGAMYIEDFRRMLASLGCFDYRVITNTPIVLNEIEMKELAGHTNFYSMTIRAFNCDFEDLCENYGHVASYLGTIEDNPNNFRLDDHHIFKKNKPVEVCGNTAKMLSETSYKKHFKVVGSFETHQGIFDCGDACSPIQSQLEGCC
ncbi:MAG: methyltransferase domain-containing protein [Thiotrichales bacterium]|nr:methyltransferase domain-containing protein [Thiotrichales bacterium]